MKSPSKILTFYKEDETMAEVIELADKFMEHMQRQKLDPVLAAGALLIAAVAMATAVKMPRSTFNHGVQEVWGEMQGNEDVTLQ